MSYDARTRNRYRLAVKATTATVAAGAMTATGWLTGAAAQDHAKELAAEQAARAARMAQTPTTVVRERPTTTRVTTRYITAATPSDPVGNGGDVNTASESDQGQSSSTQDNPAPAPPPPPPAPSNGS